ncbi:MAG: hypothetical protein ACOYN0_17390 [Phycisphaerales bacterium]
MKLPSAFAAIAIASVSLAQTASPQPGSASPPASPAQSAASPAKSALATIELKSAGAEPLAAIRYAPAKGSTERFELKLYSRNVIRMDNQAGPSGPAAEYRLECTLAVQDVTEAGEIAYSVVIDKAEVTPDDTLKPLDLDRVSKAAAAIQGSIINARIDSRGNVLSSEVVKAPSEFARVQFENVKGAITQLAAVLPEPKVGAGASWTATSSPTINSVAATQTATYTMTAADKGSKLALEFTRRAEPQDVNAPNGRQGSVMQVHSFLGAGVGESTRLFTRISPLASSLNLETEVDFTVKQAATEKMAEINQRFGQVMTIRTSVRSLDAQ